jgi:hypothetical protein
MANACMNVIEKQTASSGLLIQLSTRPIPLNAAATVRIARR